MTTTLIMGCLSLCLIALDTPVPLNAYMTPPAARVAPMQASSSTLTHAAQLRPAQRWYTQRPNEGLQYQGLRQQPARTFRGWWLEADSVSVPVPDSDSVSAQVGPADLDPHVKTYLAVNSAVLCVGGFMAWSTWSILRDLIAGATASLGVMSIGYPLDTAKTRVQIGQPAVDKDGLIGLYRGIPIGLLRESATAAIYIAVCGFLKMHLLPQTHPTAFTLVLFFVVGAVACVASSVARCRVVIPPMGQCPKLRCGRRRGGRARASDRIHEWHVGGKFSLMSTQSVTAEYPHKPPLQWNEAMAMRELRQN